MTGSTFQSVEIRLEASTHCQLKCPSCPTAAGEIQKTLGSGFLSLDRFREIIDDNPQLAKVELSNWGEIFLNPQIIKIMQYAF
jgi:MoaA/NifB/PqqE/SkfB family radical SAM enzyme